MRVTPIDEKTREIRLRQFGHVQRRAINAFVRKSDWIYIKETIIDRRRHEIKLVEVVKEEMLIKRETKGMIQDRIEQQRRIHVANLNSLYSVGDPWLTPKFWN